MANIKIGDLTAYTDPLNTDVLPIVDVTSDTTKKVSIADLLKNASAGTAAAPGIAFDGDNTGIYSPGADQLAISTNGTGRLFVAANGNVGVGTNTPGDIFEVRPSSGASSVSIRSTSADAAISIRSGASSQSLIYLGDQDDSDVGQIVYDHTGNYLNFRVNASDALRIDSSGRLGLGISSPDGLLHLQGVSGTYPTSIINHSAIDVEGEFLRVGRTDSTVRYHSVYGKQSATSSSNYLQFRVHDGSAGSGFTSQATVMTLTGQGNVGIGTTTSPLHTLEVNGDCQIGAYSAVSNAGLYVTGRDTSNDRAINIMSVDGNGGGVIGTTGDASANNGLSLSAYRGSGYFSFRTGGSDSSDEKVRIDSSGRLLVGTSTAREKFFNSASFPLQVQLETATTSARGLSVVNNSGIDVSYGSLLVLGRSAGSAVNTYNAVSANYKIGAVSYQAADGTELVEAARIEAEVDGTPGANDMPGRLVFSTTAATESSPTERMRITSDAYVRLASGTGGIQFNGDTAAANALDDYEEGTWTPSFVTGTWTYSIQKGIYTVIGDVCIASLQISWSGKSGAGSMEVNLPFSTGGAATDRFCVSYGYTQGIDTNGNKQLIGVANGNGLSKFGMLYLNDNGTPASTLVENASASGQVQMSIIYQI